MSEPGALPTFDFDQRLPGAFHFPTRMTALPLSGGELALVSPIPLDPVMRGAVAALGEVKFLIAPNRLHHLYLGAAAREYPSATVLAPRGLLTKRPDLRIDHTLDALDARLLAADVEVVAVDGAPAVEEYGFYHRKTRTLVLTDWVFNVQKPRGVIANLALWLVGCHGRLASSRALRMLVKDRAAAASSVERLLDLPFTSLVMAHGAVVHEGARESLAAAFRWLLPARVSLPVALERAAPSNAESRRL